jgi:hypothetical protein
VHQNLADLARLVGRVGGPLEKLGGHLANAQKQYERDRQAFDRFANRLETITEKADRRSSRATGDRSRSPGLSGEARVDPPAGGAAAFGPRAREFAATSRRKHLRLPASPPRVSGRRAAPVVSALSSGATRYEPESHLRDRTSSSRSGPPAGPEIDRMVPSMMEELLFDDILYGNRAREEHRRFQQVPRLRRGRGPRGPGPARGGPAGSEQRGAILDDLGRTLGLGTPRSDGPASATSNAEQLAAALITGIERPSAGDRGAVDGPLRDPPIPNYFFQRDPLVVVGERAIRARWRPPAASASPS